jgi:hypothetical protein
MAYWDKEVRMQRKIVFGWVVGMLLSGIGWSWVQADVRGGEKDVTLTGEVIDTYCYATMGARGESHRECGLECAKAGIPVGLLQEKTDTVYVLLPDKDKTGLPEGVIQKMGRTATVTGHVIKKGGSQFLVVESVK